MQATTSQDNGELFELYKLKVDEYHFQVTLNWDRTRYFLAFNTGILAVGTGLLRVGTAGAARALVAAIFAVGAVAAVLAGLAHQRQHNYYRRARDEAKALERHLGLQEWGLETTPGIRGEGGFTRWATVTNFVHLMLATLALMDSAGVIYTLFFAGRSL